MVERVVKEFPIRSIYFTQREIQNIIELMDGYLRLSFSSLPEDTAVENINELVSNTMQRAYQSLTEEV